MKILGMLMYCFENQEIITMAEFIRGTWLKLVWMGV